MAVVSLLLSFCDPSARKKALAICFLYYAPAVATNRTTPGRSVSNHDNKADHFVWRYHRLIYCDNSAETPVKKAEGRKLHFCIVTRLIQFLFNLVTTRTEISACNPNLAKTFSAFLNLPGTRIFLPSWEQPLKYEKIVVD